MSIRSRMTGAWPALAGAVGLGAFAALLALGFLHVFAPARPLARLSAYNGYDLSPMDAALAPACVSNELQAILSCGSRFQGQPGLSRAQQRVRDAFAAAHLEMYELPQEGVAPRTVIREIQGRDNRPLADVEIYPFLPNHFQPVVTPEAGCHATLVLATDDLLLTRDSFTNCIAVIDAEAPPASYGFDWIRYAQVGFQGVIVAHRKGLDHVRWENIGSLRASTPVNYPRLAATAGVFAHLGETVTVRVKVVWENVHDQTLVGILRAPRPAAEALVVTACSDAPSVLPDLAPGTLAAVNLAAQLSLLQGLSAYRDDPHRQRDVILVSYSSRMMGLLAADALTTVIGPACDRDTARKRLETAQKDNARRQEEIAACLACLDDPRFLAEAASTVARVAALPAGTQDVLKEQLRHAINTLLLERSEAQLQSRLVFLREGGQDTATPAFAHYREAKTRYDEAMNMAGLPVRKLLGTREARAFVLDADLRGRLAARLHDLSSFHAARAAYNAQAMALHQRLASYRQLIAIGSFLAPADPAYTTGEKVSFFMGLGVEQELLRQSPVINEIIGFVLQSSRPALTLTYDPLRGRGHSTWAQGLVAQVPVDVLHWNRKGYPSFVLVNTDRTDAYGRMGSPIDEPRLHRIGTMEQSLRLLGRIALALAYGQGSFAPPMKTWLNTYSGRVYLSNVGRSIIPSYPLSGALVGHKGVGDDFAQNGFYSYPFLTTDPYGWYELPDSSVSIASPWVPNSYSPEAAGFGPDGQIRYIKDEGPQGQRIYKSIKVGRWGNRANINIVTFRAAPVTLFDTVNPQTLKNYTGFGFVTRDGLASVGKYNSFTLANGIATMFLEPDCRFFITLGAGSPKNEKIQSIRAFLLGADESFRPAPDREIDGRGYLAADTAFLLGVPRQIALSMLSVDDRRLALQQRYHMADERVCAFQERGQGLLSASQTPGTPHHTSELKQRAAVTYTTLNHPVLRDTIAEAVIGILWYLGLLVPFAFFFEKLAFGFADIRKQLAAQAVIFLVVFALLRLLHPAFAMIRSSLMILLGFVILLISGGITVLFSGKFRENLEELQKQRGQVTAAAVNTMGVLGTAFTLGLNNMHRRLVRTGLTCATLVLLTFAMICFTSIRSDVVDTVTAIGKAPYQGMLIKPDLLKPMSDAELSALRDRYEPAYILTPRRMLVGAQGWDRVNYNPEVDAVYEPTNSLPQRRAVTSVLELGPREPLRNQIRLLTRGGWFTTNMVRNEIDVPPVLIADGLATALGLRPADVDRGGIMIKINGKQVRVHGIFDAASLAAVRDLDGRDIMPFDIEAMRTVQIANENVLADDSDPRLNTDGMVIVPADLGIRSGHGNFRLVSVAVGMPGSAYRPARDEVEQYLEQSGQTTYYGLGNLAYRGRRARAQTAGGLLELLIPLVIAALTVLNTMRGSVYERRDEIFVYNAVGIAPRYIFAMFFSEAFVYSVVGSLLGFLLSQGLGRALTALGWTGGLNMTFTSINTIYASLAIMAAVFLSTLFPARSAMRIAAPAEDAGWQLPEPKDDRMSFALPFTFHAQDRIAVLAFFNRYFMDHGEGSAGRFFADVPRLFVTEAAEGGAYVPGLATTIWLKPFDLGASQHLEIVLPVDPETGEFAARVTLTRLSGTRESWVRLNQTFVAILRQHFLYWRAVSPAERRTLFAEARTLLEQTAAVEEHCHA